MGKSKLKRKLPSETAGNSSAGANGGALSKKQLKKQRRQAAAADQSDDESNGNDGELREIEDLDFDDAFAAGLAFEQMESFEGALAAFQTAVKARPDHLFALSHLADVYAADEQPQLALKTYLQASKLPDADASIWFRLGMTYMSLEQHDMAIKSLKKALMLSAKTLESAEDSDDREDQMKAYSVTLAALANCHGEQGDLDSAIQVYTDAVTAFPSNGNLHYNLATMLMAKGGDSELQVVASLERAIACSPETIEFYEDLIEFLQQQTTNINKKSQQAKVQELQKKVEALKEEAAAKETVTKEDEASDDEDESSDDGDDEDANDSDEEEDTEDDE